MRTIALCLLASAVSAQAPSVAKKLTIGCESCGDATQFSTFYDVSVSSSGQILVTNKDAPMLRLFDQTGRTIWTGGQKGKGPGEYVMPYRSTLVDSGMVVVDMTNSRLTDLGAAGQLIGSTPMLGFATTVGVTPRGEMIFGIDNFGRSFKIARRAPRHSTVDEIAAFAGSMKNKSVAVAPNGTIAVALDGEKYEIIRLAPSGKTVDTIGRAVERPRRSTVEEAEYRERMNRGIAMVQAESRKQGGDGKGRPPEIPAGERGLKGHIVVDGLRFDALNRLWVLTQHGDETKTVFDVFSPSGAYVGAVTVPGRVTSYSLAGSYLATAGENEDGIPVVTLWSVK
jgi:hypothetical protein